MSPVQYICDWSHWQGDLNPKKVEAEGFAAVKLKVGGAIREGWSFVDPKFRGNAKRLLNDTPALGRMCYWYLMPGQPVAQLGLLIDSLRGLGGVDGWHVQLDVEQDGLTSDDVSDWVVAWSRLTQDRPFSLYTRHSFWVPRIDARDGMLGGWCTPILEEAHWVPEAKRINPNEPYASQQVKHVDSSWFDVNYSGWKRATFLQYSNHVLVDGRTTDASMYVGSRIDFRKVIGQ